MGGYSAIDALKKQLASGEVGTLYVFYGPEQYLLEHYLKELQKKLVPEGMEAFNIDRLDGGSVSPSELRDAVECVPMLCDKRLVIVTDYDLFKQNADTRKRLEELLAGIPDSCCLVFVYDTLEYKRDKRQKLGELIGGCALEVEFMLQEEAQLVKWIRRRFGAHGKDISPADAQYMLFLCGAKMHMLGQEVEKLAAYTKGGVITKPDLDTVVVPVLEARVFAMCSALADGKSGKAVLILQELMAMREEPVAILGALSWQLRGIYAARLVADRRLGVKDYIDLTGSRSQYQAGEMLRAARRHTLEWCRSAAELCLETDRLLKGQSRSRDRELELLLARLV